MQQQNEMDNLMFNEQELDEKNTDTRCVRAVI